MKTTNMSEIEVKIHDNLVELVEIYERLFLLKIEQQKLKTELMFGKIK